MRRSEELANGSSGGGVSRPAGRAPDGMRGELRMWEPMARHVSWRAGGTVERAYIPADIPDLAAFIRGLPRDEPIHFLGLGSNFLVRDGGLQGTAILLHGAFKRICLEQRRNGFAEAADQGAELIYAEAGVPSPKVARFAAKHGYEGAEFLAGIPGTVGGALAMNAGCYGSETWNVVAQVLTIDRNGQLCQRPPEDFEIAYRHVVPGPEMHGESWFVAAWFRLTPGDGDRSMQTIKALLQKRIASQPLSMPNAGSVFRNPPGDHAARLIESTGLKGFRLGGAMVSPKHANFIVNMGDATAADIEAVIEHVQERVKAKTGVELEREVRIVGERG